MSDGNTLVAFEGIDGSGKTTLLNAVAQACREASMPVRTTAEPAETQIGDLIEDDDASYPPIAQALLFAADRHVHFDNPLYRADGFKGVLLCDRYVDSTMAYQAPQIADQMDTSIEAAVEWIHLLHDSWVRQPPVTVYVETPPQVAAKRLHDRDGYEDEDIVEAAHSVYQRLYDDTEYTDTSLVTVDGTQPRDEMIDNGVPQILDAIAEVED